MKDILGKMIEVGDHVVYIRCSSDKNLEEAMVIRSEENLVILEYLGRGSETKSYVKRKKRGEKSRLTVTNRKVIILDSNYESYSRSKNKDLYKEEIKRFDKEMKKMKSQLEKALQEKKYLIEKNEILMVEVDKIHNRFDILDL